jgi:hypothetical protein
LGGVRPVWDKVQIKAAFFLEVPLGQLYLNNFTQRFMHYFLMNSWDFLKHFV